MNKFEILNLKYRKSPERTPRPIGAREEALLGFLEHSKIIGARKLTKNDGDHARPNFRVFWPTGRWEKWFGTPKHGGRGISG